MSESPEADAEVASNPSSGQSSDHLDSTIVDSTAREQRLQYSVEQSKHQRLLQSAAHRQDMERRRLEVELDQKRKDHDFRRLCLVLVMGLLVIAFIAAVVVGIVNDDQGTKQWAQGIATTILGGLLGAVAGYFAGRGGG